MTSRERDAELDGWVAQLADRHRAFAAHQRLVAAGDDALPAIRRGLNDADPHVRAKCCQVLDRLANEDSFTLLVGMLGDPHPRVRIDALHALACDRCKPNSCRPAEAEVLPRAVQILRQDSNKYARAMAVEVVGRSAHTSAAAQQALLMARDSDPEASVRKKAGWYAPGGSIFTRTAPRPRRSPARPH